MNKCYMCKNNSKNCSKVYQDDGNFDYVCKECVTKHNLPGTDEDGDLAQIFDCHVCKKLFWIHGNINPCYMNDLSCPELCYDCVSVTNLLIERDCGCLLCEKHDKQGCDCYG